MNDVTMNAVDAIYGALAECYVTIDGNRYNLMQMVNFDSHFQSNIVEKGTDTDDMLSAIPAIVPMQLFAYFMAVQKGLDVDKPRNLAKSVTVE